MIFKRKGSSYWWVKLKFRGKVFQKSTGTRNESEARAFEEAYRNEIRRIPESEGAEVQDWDKFCVDAIEDSQSWLRLALNTANGKNRKRFGIPPMSKAAILSVARASRGVCAVTGIPFTFGEARNSNPRAVSIDRIDSRYGYTRDNIRFVLFSVNLAMNKWGEDAFWRIADAAVAKRGAGTQNRTEI